MLLIHNINVKYRRPNEIVYTGFSCWIRCTLRWLWNKMNLMLWLDYRHQIEPMTLFKLWRSQFALALRDDHKKLEMIVEG